MMKLDSVLWDQVKYLTIKKNKQTTKHFVEDGYVFLFVLVYRLCLG